MILHGFGPVAVLLTLIGMLVRFGRLGNVVTYCILPTHGFIMAAVIALARQHWGMIGFEPNVTAEHPMQLQLQLAPLTECRLNESRDTYIHIRACDS